MSIPRKWVGGWVGGVEGPAMSPQGQGTSTASRVD